MFKKFLKEIQDKAQKSAEQALGVENAEKLKNSFKSGAKKLRNGVNDLKETLNEAINQNDAPVEPQQQTQADFPPMPVAPFEPQPKELTRDEKKALVAKELGRQLLSAASDSREYFDLEKAKALVIAGASLTEKDSNGTDALGLSVFVGWQARVDFTLFLIAAKAPLDERDNFGVSAIERVVSFGNKKVFDALAAAGAATDRKTFDGGTLKELAVKYAQPEIAAALEALESKQPLPAKGTTRQRAPKK